MKDNFVQTVKSRGYWRVNFMPVGPPKQLTMQECRELISQNSVKLRGWHFPFYYDGQADHYAVANHNDYLGGWIDAGEQKEFWRMYRSGQFLHYAVVDEDWMEGTDERQLSNMKIEPGKYLNFVGSLTYYLTEIIEFLTRLYKAGLYQEGVIVSISLHNTKGRELTAFNARHLSFPKKTDEETIRFNKKYDSKELQQKASDIAIEPILYFFEMFNFENVSVDQVIRKDQESLYNGRIW